MAAVMTEWVGGTLVCTGVVCGMFGWPLLQGMVTAGGFLVGAGVGSGVGANLGWTPISTAILVVLAGLACAWLAKALFRGFLATHAFVAGCVTAWNLTAAMGTGETRTVIALGAGIVAAILALVFVRVIFCVGTAFVGSALVCMGAALFVEPGKWVAQDGSFQIDDLFAQPVFMCAWILLALLFTYMQLKLTKKAVG